MKSLNIMNALCDNVDNKYIGGRAAVAPLAPRREVVQIRTKFAKTNEQTRKQTRIIHQKKLRIIIYK